MLSESEARESVIVALDCDRKEALRLAGQLEGRARWVKVGMTLFYAEGPSIVREMGERGLRVFLDLKLHDIPFQVFGAARSASLSGADMLSIHALGSAQMVSQARAGVERAAEECGRDRTRLVAISVLTSMDEEALSSVGIDRDLSDEVSRLASLAVGAGSDGIVCSPQEAASMRALLGPDALIVTPGVRPAGAALGDQRRVATPAAAIAAGASKLVVGRPVTQAGDPVATFESIVSELCEG
ncbi:orotidine-5'-phosphate decarboxylase [Olsenella sp. oral taxon 809]|uniref:orotidine-5'-phosphate decarboxylase n=1 Tax=Olsenella sp. oral taxon 809 TaxID=661086 RepID=UPI000231F32B|nr:orotidine-5'-phosphate decarboxylase [Olsenella sp. oral taxon 809]EHF01881.1 orotidine 5'-phosphate decarboxylase [Olsenella sp. oral taxon 809 str. F0356]